MNTLSDPKAPIKASCHCGAVTVTTPGHPQDPINVCQCTICRRYGAEWAYYYTDDVKVEIQQGASTGKYIWGWKAASFEWCTRCGCLVYWWPTADRSDESKGMGVNSRMMGPDALRGVNRVECYDDLFRPSPGTKGAEGQE